MHKVSFILLSVFCGLTACQSNRRIKSVVEKQITADAFAEGSHERLSFELEGMKILEKSLQFESEWLKHRTLVVEAEKYACQCRLSELRLAAEMAKFGSFDQRLPEDGFINDAERVRWNEQLEIKQSTRITAEARANLLRRDLNDLTEKLVNAGYQVPVDFVIK